MDDQDLQCSPFFPFLLKISLCNVDLSVLKPADEFAFPSVFAGAVSVGETHFADIATSNWLIHFRNRLSA